MSRISNGRDLMLVSILLIGITLACFWPAFQNDFINCDDQVYVTENEMVLKGLSWDGFKWAFTTGHGANWHPLTWLSHMADVEMFGLKPGWHHGVNVVFHIFGTVLLFLLLQRMTGAMGPSAVVAASFAVHPLHVESVAWVAERKDVLSTLFFMLTLWCYSHFVTSSKARLWYLCALTAFALGLMSKPMVVTLPFVLLLLDFWPLGRLKLPRALTGVEFRGEKQTLLPRGNLDRLIIEKAPFFLLTLASCVVTYLVQQKGGAVIATEEIPVEMRLLNAATTYLLYLVKTFWPVGLAPFYPFSTERATTLGWIALLVLAVLTWFAAKGWRKRPFIAVGWLWYLGTLVPVIGIVQVGLQSMADRYSYIPLVGVFIGVVWGVAHFAEGRIRWALPIRVALIVCLTALGALTFQQVRRWENSETLFRHTLAVTRENALAHESLGGALAKQGMLEQAYVHFKEAVRINPRYTTALGDLGLALVMKGQVAEGIERYRQALALDPNLQDTHYNLGRALLLQGKPEEAARHLEAAIKLRPSDYEARASLARALGDLGRFVEAETQFQEVLKASPSDASTRFHYGSMLGAAGRMPEAMEQFREALRLGHKDPELHRRYGILLARTGNTEAAAKHFEEVMRLRPDADACYHLALTGVVQGRHAEAAELYRQALAINPDFADALNDLAWLLATHPDPALRNGSEAVKHAEKACALTGDKVPRFLGTLDAAYAEAGDFPSAIKTAERVAALFQASGEEALAELARDRMALYREGKAFRQNQ